eukprot:gene6408-11848_t
MAHGISNNNRHKLVDLPHYNSRTSLFIRWRNNEAYGLYVDGLYVDDEIMFHPIWNEAKPTIEEKDERSLCQSLRAMVVASSGRHMGRFRLPKLGFIAKKRKSRSVDLPADDSSLEFERIRERAIRRWQTYTPGCTTVLVSGRSPIEEFHRLFPSLPSEEFPLNGSFLLYGGYLHKTL